MKALSWARSRPKTLASVAGVAIGAVALTGMAVAYDGLPTTKVDLNDAGVWLTKSSDFLVGHFNNDSTVLDGGLRAASNDYDVLQDAGMVLLEDQSENTVTVVDPARVSLGDTASIPPGAVVELGNNTVAILEPKSGDLWVTSALGLAGFDIKGAKPTAELGKGSDVVVGRDGTVYALSGQRSEVLTIPADAEGLPLEPKTSSLDEVDLTSPPSITVVGDKPVVLDAAAGVVTTPGGFRTEIDAAQDAVLQQASVESDSVAVATPNALVSVPLDGSEPVETVAPGSGTPAVPVQLRGCTYGAWAVSATFIRDCAGDSMDLMQNIPGAENSTHLSFRVNRDVVILNDIIGGAAWLTNESMQRVDDWDSLTPPEGENEDDENTTEEAVETSLPERKEQNTPPDAVDDDSLGVRPGGTTLLPVLDNDNDPDGDILVASVKGKQPSVGEVQPILNGAALQISVPEDATGSASFMYEVEDGRKGKDTANVSLTVYDWDDNTAPRPARTTKLAVETGGTVSYNVLPDWRDPEGDDLYLRNVVAAQGDEVEFTTDGKLTYRAVSSLQGRKEIKVTVSDSLGKVNEGTILLDVKPEGSTNPLTNADHVVTRVGESATVAPLANDTTAGREQLRLARVEDTPGTTITPDTANRQFTVKADVAGTYYVQYLVTAGPKSAKGIVRVDVLDEKQQSELDPVAVRDVAMLPSGSEALVGVLGNDTDPSGGVLVVQSVSVPPSSGVNVSVLNHETLRISDQGSLTEPVSISYRISNGNKSAEGDVIVIPIPAPTKLLPPVASDDEVVVRVGDVVTIPVLDNDVHPNGDTLTVAPDLVEPLVDPADGEAFVSQNTVRFRAGQNPGTVYLTYEVEDSRAQKDGGHVTVQVLPIDEDDTNAAPNPRDLTARALSGSSINIPVPLDGLDTDGDSVELIGIDLAPKKGRVVEQGANYLTYEAYEDSTGVDSFTYLVRDRLGATGRATVRVGVAPPEATNQAPYAINDSVVVRPGRSVAVPATANDSDPEGDTVVLVKSGLVLPDVEGLDAEVSGDRVIVTVPDRELETSLQYEISDTRGARTSAAIFVTVDEDVPLMNPVARDDRVQVEDIDDELTAELDILRNDEDPDGTIEGVTVDVEDGAVLGSDGKATVEIGPERQLIRYTLTDQDGLTASAFIFVPAQRELRPRLISTKPVEVKSGETIELPLSKYVAVAGGGDVRVTEAAKVSAANANGDSLIKDEKTLVYTSKDRYFGTDGLTVEVTDGTGPDDPDGRKATVTIPINVLPPDNQPPTFTGAQMQVAPGEDATELDLTGLVSDPDPEDADNLKFTIVGQPGDGISAHLDGAMLLAETGASTPKGTTSTVQLSVTDGETAPVEATIQVTVTASTRTMPVASPDNVDEADQGETITVPVLANDINPFETDGEPLRVLTADVESGQGSARVVGDEVQVTSGGAFVGVMVVRYRIQDATKDPDREVEGRITIAVQGVPEAPGKPTVTAVEDRTVVLNWSSPSNNGAEITEYTVTSVSGSPYSKKCESTTCTLDKLTNNVEYTFQVTATNRVGEGPASPASEVARPDTRPDTPLAPKLVFGDKALDISWTTPNSDGSPVESYTLEISPPPVSTGIAQKTGITGNSLRWEGLENGTSYTVRVRAHNKAPDPSGWSRDSAPETPAGIPGVVAAPAVSSAPSVGSEAQMSVSWGAAFKNGDTISEYELIVYRGGSEVRRIKVSGSVLSQTVTVPTAATDYTYAVRAKNKAGWNQPGPQSTPKRAFGTPLAPASVTATPKDNAIGVSVSMPDSALNGANRGEIRYQIQLNAGAWQNWNGSSDIAAKNSIDSTVRVRAYSVVAGQESNSGPSTASNTVVPFGKPFAPTGNASRTGGGMSIELTWNAKGSANGRPITTYISVDGGAWQKKNAASGSITVGNGYSQTHTIKVRVEATEGGAAESPVYSATTKPKPQPSAQTVKGASGNWPGECGTQSCAYMAIEVANFPAGNYRLYCNDGGEWGGGSVIYVPENGRASATCFYGMPGKQVHVRIGGWGNAASMTWY